MGLTVLPHREIHGQAPSPDLELRSWKPLLFNDSVDSRSASPGGIDPGVSGNPQRPTSVLLSRDTTVPRETKTEVRSVAISEGFMLAKEVATLLLAIDTGVGCVGGSMLFSAVLSLL